ncbi:4Fe-4S dicluster domain-containing protein [Geobacter sp. DSM 9736]|uniref:4Fe-4S dicluster domain-containing protein n=1 Tax=Geobacter sp. DSM 9736 TaxID=1277350 RepID=UPI000B504A95|nr:4Fe-4S dicluster domain-containing protein [Geobacter sp. DSM 9736]SNB47708.1 Fe-S-cluster-containing dehydrogenase component [Geobacter sp. DSM 9736]
MINRRRFCKQTLLFIGGMAIPLAAIELFDPKRLVAENDTSPVRWGFLVDTRKCTGCGLCVRACKIENDTPYDAKVTRTWVERYVVTKKGETLIDSPKGGRDGFVRSEIDQEEHGLRDVDENEIAKAFFVPKLCNQCDNPPCVQVCPVGATYQTADGVVLVDRSWCIGCGYCIMGCPYGVRFFHPVHRAAEKCNFCYHRLAKGLKSACVHACPFDARRIGNLRNPDDPVTKIINTERVGVLKEEYGTKPQVFYLGLSLEVR